MLYFSELDGAQVYTNNQKFVGKLQDLVFTILGTPLIKKIVISTQKKSLFGLINRKSMIFVSAEHVFKLDPKKIIIDHNFEKSQIDENELFVKKNLMDTQVIDIEENNIVRVNDVVIQKINSHSVIYGADIGFSGFLRQLGIEQLISRFFHIFGKYYIPQSILAWSDIQPLELTRGRVAVKSHFDSLKKLHPADVADYLETQTFNNAMTLIGGIDKEYLSEVMSELNPSYQINLFKVMSIDKIMQIINLMDTDDVVDIIAQLPHKKQDMIFAHLDKNDTAKIKRLLELSESPLGNHLIPDYLVVSPEQTCSDVIKKIKDYTSEYILLEDIYVVNKDKHIIGVFNLHELLMQGSDTPVFKFMIPKVISVNLNTPAEVALRRMVKYDISSLPVVDNERRIIGLVSLRDLNRDLAENEK